MIQAFLFGGGVRGVAAHAVLAFLILLFLTLLFLTIWVHVGQNKAEEKLAALVPVYADLVKSVRSGRATDEDIKKSVLPSDFPTFQRFLKLSISSVEEIDVSAEKRIADVSGFINHLKKRIATSTKWNKTLALRILSSLRDARNIPLFREILEKDNFIQAVYAAGLGLALCKDTVSVVAVSRRLWEISAKNHDALLLILYIYGKDIAPIALRALEEDTIVDDAKPVILDYLSEFPCDGTTATLIKMIQKDPPESILKALLSTLRHLRSKESLDAVLPHLHHKNFMVRIEAVLAVADLGGAETLPRMEECMRDENWWVRREAAKGMATMGNSGLAHLRVLADTTDENSRAAARTVLAELQFNRIAAVGF